MPLGLLFARPGYSMVHRFAMLLTLVILMLSRWDQEDTNMVTNFFQDVIVNAKPKVVFQRNFDSFKMKQSKFV